MKCSSPAALRTFRAVNNLSCTWLGTAWAEGFSYLPDPGSERWSWQKPWEMWVCRISYCGAERKKDQSFPPAGNHSSLQGGTHTLVLGFLSHFMCGSLTHLLQDAIMETHRTPTSSPQSELTTFPWILLFPTQILLRCLGAQGRGGEGT